MRKYKVISFDLQGTLSDSAFSDEFWQEILPKLWARKNNLITKEAKNELSHVFRSIGRYDIRYYSWRYWINLVSPTLQFQDIQHLICSKPIFYPKWIPLLSALKRKYQLIISSSTSSDFIATELGRQKDLFSSVFSSLDDFNMAGKPPEFYRKIAEKLSVKQSEIIHIGNDKEMDYENPIAAGSDAIYFEKSSN